MHSVVNLTVSTNNDFVRTAFGGRFDQGHTYQFISYPNVIALRARTGGFIYLI